MLPMHVFCWSSSRLYYFYFFKHLYGLPYIKPLLSKFFVVAFLYNIEMLEVLGEKARCLFQCEYHLTPQFVLTYFTSKLIPCLVGHILYSGYWISWWSGLGYSCCPGLPALSQRSSQHAGF